MKIDDFITLLWNKKYNFITVIYNKNIELIYILRYNIKHV